MTGAPDSGTSGTPGTSGAAASGAPKRDDADLALDALRSGPPRSGHGQKRGAISSDLSVDEAIVIEQAGYEPRGLVSGTCVFRPYIFGSWAPMSQNTELTTLSGALHEARTVAMRRMRNQAGRVAGEGVVGVRLSVETSSREFRFTAIGTAVARRNARPSNQAEQIFTSDLSGKDFALLTAAGYKPLGLVMGVCVYHVARQSAGTWLKNQGQNTELVLITSALYDSRELAMGRMQEEALGLGAHGVV
ncbi:MAG: heavy metal-binding domain-containing protein, partial [Acidimicrobiales bacterium]